MPTTVTVCRPASNPASIYEQSGYGGVGTTIGSNRPTYYGADGDTSDRYDLGTVTYANIDEAVADDSDYVNPGTVLSGTPIDYWMWTSYGLSGVPSGISISGVTVVARHYAYSGNSNTWDAQTWAMCVIGTTRYFAGTTVGSGSIPLTVGGSKPSSGIIYETKRYATWTVNPATAAAWTYADIIAAKFGWVGWVDNLDNSGSGWRLRTTHMYVEVEGTPQVQIIEQIRSMSSMHLRSFRKPTKAARIVVPIQYGGYSPGQEIEASHREGPAPDGGGWREAAGSRRDLFMLGTEFNPMTKMVTLYAKDMREEECRLWLQAVQDIGFSDDGQGVAFVHSGGNNLLTATRTWASTFAATQRPGDYRYVGSIDNVPRYDWRGLVADGNGERNLFANSSFSQGTGDTFTSWTKATAGTGTVTQDTGDYLFDKTSYQRSVKLSVGSGGNAAYISQTVSLTINRKYRFRVWWKADQSNTPNTGYNGVALTLRRDATGNDYSFAAGTWTAATVMNMLPVVDHSNPEFCEHSNRWGTYAAAQTLADGEFVFTAPASGNYTFYLGCIVGATANHSFHLYQVELLEVVGAETSMYPNARCTPIVTTSAALTRTADAVTIQNPVATPWHDWSDLARPLRIQMEVWPQFNHDDMADNEVRIFWKDEAPGRLHQMIIYYTRNTATTGQFVFMYRKPALGTGVGYYTYDYCTVSLARTGDGQSLPGPHTRYRICAVMTGANGFASKSAYKMYIMVRELTGGGVDGKGRAFGTIPSTKGSWLKGSEASYTPLAGEYSPVEWTALTNVTRWPGELDGLYRSAATDAWDGGGFGARGFVTGAGTNGFLQFRLDRTLLMVGLSNTNPDNTYSSIKHAIYASGAGGATSGTLEVWESNVVKYGSGGTGQAWTQGDHCWIEMAGTTIRYYYIPAGSQAKTLIYTSATAASGTLYPDCSLYYGSTANDSSFKNCFIYCSNAANLTGSAAYSTANAATPRAYLDQGNLNFDGDWYPSSGGMFYRSLEVSHRVPYDEEIYKW